MSRVTVHFPTLPLQEAASHPGGITRENAVEAAQENLRAISGEGDATIETAITALEAIVGQAAAGRLTPELLRAVLNEADQVVNMAGTFGYAALAYASLATGLGKLEINQEALAADLDASWEVLAEPIQTVMRRFGVQGAYEKLKEVTRGKTVTAEALHTLIRSLEIPQTEKDRLLAMTPASYVGKAAELARRT